MKLEIRLNFGVIIQFFAGFRNVFILIRFSSFRFTNISFRSVSFNDFIKKNTIRFVSFQKNVVSFQKIIRFLPKCFIFIFISFLFVSSLFRFVSVSEEYRFVSFPELEIYLPFRFVSFRYSKLCVLRFVPCRFVSFLTLIFL
jgi:hypothetical protein